MEFTKSIQSENGVIYAIDMIPTNDNKAMVAARQSRTMELQQVHGLLGHVGFQMTVATAHKNGWKIDHNNLNDTCKSCQIGKAKRKDLHREAKNKSNIAGERLMIDMSLVKGNNQKQVGKFWLLIVNKAANMKWSFFLARKSDQSQVIKDFVKQLRGMKPKSVKYIRCNNAGENKVLEKTLGESGIIFEYTGRETPQQNGKVERAFATLFGQMRSIMIAAGMNEEKRRELWTKAASTETKLSNIIVK